MQIDPRHLVHLAVIIDKASFTEAALALNMTQPALSKMLGTLEHRVGAPILSKRRPVIATPLGDQLAEQGRLIQASLTSTSQVLRDHKNGMTQRLRIGGPPFFLEGGAAGVVREFTDRFPTVALEFSMGYLDDVRDMVLNRRLDLALGPTNVNLNAPTLKAETVAIMSKGIFCRADHPLIKKANVSPSDLEAQVWIGHGRSSVIAREMSSDLFAAGVRNINMAGESVSVSIMIALLETTDYLAYLPLYLMRDAFRRGTIDHLLFDGQPSQTPFGFIYPERSENDPTILGFKEITGAHLKSAEQEVSERMTARRDAN